MWAHREGHEEHDMCAAPVLVHVPSCPKKSIETCKGDRSLWVGYHNEPMRVIYCENLNFNLIFSQKGINFGSGFDIEREYSIQGALTKK